MPLPRRASFLALAAFTVQGCARDEPPAEVAAAPQPPPAEFLIAAGDSTYWVTSGADGMRVRGSPIVLARYDERFYELYTADDDRSYPDAVLIGQRIFRRDLVTGDSVVVFEDTTVVRIADAYAAAHPDETPLEADEEASDEPATLATSEAEIVDVHGRYMTYDYRADLDAAGDLAHTARRGVIDLRSGDRMTIPALFGARAALVVTRAGRVLLAAALDSVQAMGSDRARRAMAALAGFTFDEGSFGLASLAGEPAVEFRVPGRGARAGGYALGLPSVAVPPPPPAWWRDVRPSLPDGRANDGTELWTRGTYEVIARYDSVGGPLALALRDRGREWGVARLPAPARHVIWLDASTLDSTARIALARAFDESALYSDDARIAMASGPPAGRRAATLRNPSLSPRPGAYRSSSHGPAQLSPRSRVAARDVGDHDAAGRQRAGACVRRGNHVDHGQVRGGRRHPARTPCLRYRVGRSHRFS